MKKRNRSIAFAILVLSISLSSAVNLDVDVEPIQNNAIGEINEPAIFELTIKNLGDTDNFEIYSLVGVDISPDASFSLMSGQTKKIKIEIMPREALMAKKGPITLEYKIKDSQNQIQAEKLTINIIELEDAFSITTANINPKSEETKLTIKNRIAYDFKDIKVKMQSVFFEFEDAFSLGPFETREFSIPLDSEKIKTYVAGPYLSNIKITVKDVTSDIESVIKFLEQEDIEITENREGIFIKRAEITKTNVGNIVKSVEINMEKNLVSYLFTTFNIAPTEIKRTGFKIDYLWKKELIPNEKLNVIVKTNWFYPIIIVLLAIGLFLSIKGYVESDLILTKKVSFVRTKGGEFALKVTLRAKATKFVERIHVIDKLPHLVELYSKYGVINPDKVDLKNRRIEWNVPSLNEKEERIFSYIIYSKIGVVGKFELPCAKAIYEKNGKVKTAESNRSFFINEPKKD